MDGTVPAGLGVPQSRYELSAGHLQNRPQSVEFHAVALQMIESPGLNMAGQNIQDFVSILGHLPHM
jgi:hypothetical protein